MKNLWLFAFLLTISCHGFATEVKYIIPPHEQGEIENQIYFEYAPMDILDNASGESMQTLLGTYHSYNQTIDGDVGIHYAAWLQEAKSKLTAAGYQILFYCDKDCEAWKYKEMTDKGFRKEVNQYAYCCSSSNKDIAYLTATKQQAEQTYAISLFANGKDDDLHIAYEQLVTRDEPTSHVSVDQGFKIEPLDFSSFEVPEPDEENTADHPLLSRFPGSYLVASSRSDFELYPLITGIMKDDKIPNKMVEGKVTTLNYRIDKQVGTYATHKNYLNALQAAGFTVITECPAKTCGNELLWHNYSDTVFKSRHHTNFQNLKSRSNYYFFSAEKSTPEGKIYLSMVSAQLFNTHPVELVVDIIEEKSISQANLNINSDSLIKAIAAQGKVALYGIEFDFDQHTIKPSSTQQLTEIANFLNEKPEVALYVVGHTDNKGSYEYNQDLAEKRATEVVNTLVSQFKIAASRLQPVGVGPVAPKAANDTDGSRQQNRRVELVLKAPLFL
ncbi:OmpA family protein [Motilimonas sp. 1_MG-2023]|uniref:OmpA family protein n=1 Tax=Motilimonas sp. 1_MG-2023 TaxID=3062672 RepID=UPI0026E206C0|nr:OmpA family protein [Motilimonas sp. 1_MG-2023]MDO6527878.1 OmpA family protein [Motilimonas sp. 1_MG-2023]